MTDMDIAMRDEPDESAYVADVDGERAGKAEYRNRDGSRIFRHTEVDDRFSGAGVGTKLVRYALDDVRDSGGTVVPLCPFFAAYIKRHPEYEDIVDHEMTEMYRSRVKGRD